MLGFNEAIVANLGVRTNVRLDGQLLYCSLSASLQTIQGDDTNYSCVLFYLIAT